LKDIHCVEKMIFRTFPKIAKAAEMPELTQGVHDTPRKDTAPNRASWTSVRNDRKRPQTKSCQAINDIVAEGEETVEDFGASVAIDTGLVAATQAVEHYEMAP
jgi:ferritin-like metal-binding protein YciE